MLLKNISCLDNFQQCSLNLVSLQGRILCWKYFLHKICLFLMSLYNYWCTYRDLKWFIFTLSLSHYDRFSDEFWYIRTHQFSLEPLYTPRDGLIIMMKACGLCRSIHTFWKNWWHRNGVECDTKSPNCPPQAWIHSFSSPRLTATKSEAACYLTHSQRKMNSYLFQGYCAKWRQQNWWVYELGIVIFILTINLYSNFPTLLNKILHKGKTIGTNYYNWLFHKSYYMVKWQSSLQWTLPLTLRYPIRSTFYS